MGVYSHNKSKETLKPKAETIICVEAYTLCVFEPITHQSLMETRGRFIHVRFVAQWYEFLIGSQTGEPKGSTDTLAASSSHSHGSPSLIHLQSQNAISDSQ